MNIEGNLHNSRSAPFSFSFACYSYRNQNRAKTGNCKKAMLILKTGEEWTEKYFQIFERFGQTVLTSLRICPNDVQKSPVQNPRSYYNCMDRSNKNFSDWNS
jgi:hypothetical protein